MRHHQEGGEQRAARESGIERRIGARQIRRHVGEGAAWGRCEEKEAEGDALGGAKGPEYPNRDQRNDEDGRAERREKSWEEPGSRGLQRLDEGGAVDGDADKEHDDCDHDFLGRPPDGAAEVDGHGSEGTLPAENGVFTVEKSS